MDNESWTFGSAEFDKSKLKSKLECVCYCDKEGNIHEGFPPNLFEDLDKLLQEFSNSRLPFCFTYEYMLECYCAIMEFSNFDRCCITIDDESEHFTIRLQFSNSDFSLRRPLVSVVADSLDAKFIHFMNCRKEADFKPSVQEIIKKSRTFK